MRRRILILAKSHKRRNDGVNYGFCVAGVSLEPNENYRWYRLVADSEGDSLLYSQYENSLNVLDIIDAEVTPSPRNNHIENHILGSFQKIGQKSLVELKDIFNHMSHSFFGTMANTYTGRPTNSLTILLAKDIHIYRMQLNGKSYQKVDFTMNRHQATAVSMTDPHHYTKKDSDEVKTIEYAICVASLPNQPTFQNQYSKFLASIIEIPEYLAESSQQHPEHTNQCFSDDILLNDIPF